jgi:Fe2+ transport system protein FeoA
MPSLSSLADLPAGHSALIGSMATGNPALTRLRELGVSPGTLVRVVRRAPLGDPIEICVRGSRLAMRNREAAFIQLVSHE